MKLTKQSWLTRIFATFSLFFLSVSAFAQGSKGRPSANKNLITREEALESGLSNQIAVVSAPLNNTYLLLLGAAFVVGFGFFIFAWIKYRKEKDKPEEQQEQTKFFVIAAVGVALMAAPAFVLVFSDTLGFGQGIGQGVSQEMQLNKNKGGYGIGNKGVADGFTANQ